MTRRSLAARAFGSKLLKSVLAMMSLTVSLTDMECGCCCCSCCRMAACWAACAANCCCWILSASACLALYSACCRRNSCCCRDCGDGDGALIIGCAGGSDCPNCARCGRGLGVATCGRPKVVLNERAEPEREMGCCPRVFCS